MNEKIENSANKSSFTQGDFKRLINKLLVFCFIVFVVLIAGLIGYLLGVKNTVKKISEVANSEVVPTVSVSSEKKAYSPKLSAFMRNGEIWVKDYSTNSEKKISKSGKVEDPKFSPNGKYVTYSGIGYVTGGFPRYPLYISDVDGKTEKMFTLGFNHFSSRLVWSTDSLQLGMVLFGNGIISTDPSNDGKVYIYDVNTAQEILVGNLVDTFKVEASCEGHKQKYIDFCNYYVAVLGSGGAIIEDFPGAYNFEYFEKSSYSKPGYKLFWSEDLLNDLVLLEYYTGEPQNPESKWGIGGGMFIPGYDLGVKETYSILLNESTGEVIDEIQNAVNTDFFF